VAGLGLALEGERVFAARYNGNIAAPDVRPASAWSTDTKLPTGRPRGRRGLVVAGARLRLVALDSATGAQVAHAHQRNPSAPAVTEQHVLLRTVDRVSSLAPPMASSNGAPSSRCQGFHCGAPCSGRCRRAVIAGFDKWRILALQQRNGDTIWEVTVAPPSGRSELDRLVDIDSVVKVGQRHLRSGLPGGGAHRP
jgi:outer membrane protein assembly factor BamB